MNNKGEIKRKHPIARHKFTFDQRASDRLTSIIGSWTFVLLYVLFVLAWVVLNVFILIEERNLSAFDPYPFIFLNLVLAFLAALQAPIILMAQNRQQHKEDLKMEYDYELNKKSEREIEDIKSQMNRIEKKLK